MLMTAPMITASTTLAASWARFGSMATRTAASPLAATSSEPIDTQNAAPAVIHAPTVRRFTASPR